MVVGSSPTGPTTFFCEHFGLKFALDQYNYQFCASGKFVDDYIDNPLIDTWYSVEEFEKGTPWRFVEEYKLDVSIDLLREIFKNDRYSSEPTDYAFAPYLELEYAEALKPHVHFKFDLQNHDYWIEKRAEGEEREIGGEDEEFIG